MVDIPLQEGEMSYIDISRHMPNDKRKANFFEKGNVLYQNSSYW